MGACASKPNEANGPTPTEAPATENSVSREITDAPTGAKTEEKVKAPLVDISEPKPQETESTEPTQTQAVVEELASNLVNTEAPAEPKQETKEEIKAAETEDDEIKTQETPIKAESKAEETKEESKTQETPVKEESKVEETKN